MRRSRKGAGLYLLLCFLVLAGPIASAQAAGLPPGRALGPDGLEMETSTPATSAPAVYTVKRGDTLWEIATAHGLMPDDLVALNPGLDPKVLHPGQTLIVPADPQESSNRPPGGEAPTPSTATSESAKLAAPSGNNYTVRAGDTLWGIATTHGLMPDDLIRANPTFDPKVLHPGQTLFVPGERTGSADGPPAGETSSSSASTPEPTKPPVPTGYDYTVQAGDTLWDIATAHGLMPDDLMRANPKFDPKVLRPGQTLFVPAKPAAVARKTPPPAPTKAPPPTPAPAKAPAAASNPTPTPLPTPQPEVKPAPAGLAAPGLPPQLAGWPETLLNRINEQRTARKLPALTWSPELAAAAQAHAADCGKRNYGSHVGSDGAALRTRLARAGYAARAASENWANAGRVQGTFSMWFNEPPGADPHRRNILDPQYKEIGIGIAVGRWGYYFVADFASR